MCCYLCIDLVRGGVPGPAGLALARPLFSGSLVSFPDCRDSLRTRPTSGSGTRHGPTRLHRHPRVAKYTIMRIRRAAACMLAIWPHSAACSRAASQCNRNCRPIAEAYCGDFPPAPVFPVSETTVWKERCVQVCSTKLVRFLEVVEL